MVLAPSVLYHITPSPFLLSMYKESAWRDSASLQGFHVALAMLDMEQYMQCGVQQPTC